MSIVDDYVAALIDSFPNDEVDDDPADYQCS